MAALVASGAAFAVTVPPLHLGADPQLLTHNPLGQVPTLRAGDEVMTESVAIVERLNRLHPAAGILPTAERERTACLSGLLLCSSQLHPALTRISFAPRICDASPAAEERVRQLAREQMATRLAVIEAELGEGDWWRSASPSMADHYLAWVSAKLQRLGFDPMEFPRISGHLSRLRETWCYREVMRREENLVHELEQTFGYLPETVRQRMLS